MIHFFHFDYIFNPFCFFCKLYYGICMRKNKLLFKGPSRTPTFGSLFTVLHKHFHSNECYSDILISIKPTPILNKTFFFNFEGWILNNPCLIFCICITKNAFDLLVSIQVIHTEQSHQVLGMWQSETSQFSTSEGTQPIPRWESSIGKLSFHQRWPIF